MRDMPAHMRPHAARHFAKKHVSRHTGRMHMLPFRTEQDALQAQPSVIAVLEQGGVVVIPTDTSYGMAADATNSVAIRRIYDIKGRDFTKSLHVIVSDMDMAGRYVDVNAFARALCNQFLPGPITFLLPSKGLLPHDLTHDSPFIGVRIPQTPLITQLVHAFGRPVTATSANVSGEPDVYSAIEICEQFATRKSRPDLILDAGEIAQVQPSTMVAIHPDHTLQLVRKGPISFEQVQQFARTIR